MYLVSRNGKGLWGKRSVIDTVVLCVECRMYSLLLNFTVYFFYFLKKDTNDGFDFFFFLWSYEKPQEEQKQYVMEGDNFL